MYAQQLTRIKKMKESNAIVVEIQNNTWLLTFFGFVADWSDLYQWITGAGNPKAVQGKVTVCPSLVIISPDDKLTSNRGGTEG